MRFLEQPTRNFFFTGKGGVGKTSIACITAIALADYGKRVLLVSTDPASNLDEVLGATLGQKPTPVPGVANLWGMNIDPESAARAYRERMVEPYRNLLPAAALQSIEEQFSGSCTLEIAAFDEFARLLGDPQATASFDHVLFDTAPTGHTLRLLSLPSAWTGFLQTNTTGTSCLGPLAGLQAQQGLYQNTITVLGDGAKTTLVLVARPEPSALREAQRTSRELSELGVSNQHLVVNGVFTATDLSDPIAVAMDNIARRSIEDIPAELALLPQTIVPLQSRSLIGAATLRSLDSAEFNKPSTPLEEGILDQKKTDTLSSLVEELATSPNGILMTMGKGGVGKTTIAAALAVALAQRGHSVHLTTTDPAAHLLETVNGSSANLRISRIDPMVETEKYSAEVLATAGSGLDAAGKAVLAEDLRSPCTEEIAVFRAFAGAVADGVEEWVILDTAPTGHTILLLDAALSYHREVLRQSSGMPESVTNLLPRLRDRALTRVLIVTLPEATPVHEAAQLQRDLERAEIHPFAWVVNRSLSPLALRDPLLQSRRAGEARYIREVNEEQADRTILVPWQAEPLVGVDALRRLVEDQPAFTGATSPNSVGAQP